jgi:hypothetical protein
MVVLATRHHPLHFRSKRLTLKKQDVSSLNLGKELSICYSHLLPENWLFIGDLEMCLKVDFVNNLVQTLPPISIGDRALPQEEWLMQQGLLFEPDGSRYIVAEGLRQHYRLRVSYIVE